MNRFILLALLCAVPCFSAVVTPTSFGGPYCLTPPFGTAACSITDQYKAGGLIFSQDGVGTAVFNDPPNAWGGINGAGKVDLLAPVNGAIVVPGTLIPGVTGSISVEAGHADAGALQLTVYGVGGGVLATRLNGLDGTGPHGRHLITISIAGIRSFSVSTPRGDTFGVDQIDVGTISAADGVPEPGTILLLTSGLAFLVYSKVRR